MNQTTKEVQDIVSGLDNASQLQFKLGYETREAEEQEGFADGVRRAVELLSLRDGVSDKESVHRLYKSVMEQIGIQKGRA